MKLRVLRGSKAHYVLLHFAVLSGDEIVALSFAGTTGDVRAVVSGVKKAGVDIIHKRNEKYKYADGEYKKYEEKIDELIRHSVVLHQSAFPSDNNADVVLCLDGDTTPVTNFLVEKFALPEEWREEYWNIFHDRIKALTVFTEEEGTYKDLKAYRVQINEDEVRGRISSYLKNGSLLVPESDSSGEFHAAWDMNHYLRQNAPNIDAQSRVDPYHDNRDPDRKLLKSIATMGRIPLPAQADRVQALFNELQVEDHAFLSGETGVGKSTTFNSLCNAFCQELNKGEYTPVLLTAPATVLPKWEKEEILLDHPNASIVNIRDVNDALEYVEKVKSGHKPKGLEFVLLGIDLAKYGPVKWVGAAIWKRIYSNGAPTRRYGWHCPDCFAPLEDPLLKDHENNPVVAQWNAMAEGEKNHEEGAIKPIPWLTHTMSISGIPTAQRSLPACHVCDAKLWRPANKQADGASAGKKRWHICRIFHKRLKDHFHLFGADEIHKSKNLSQRGVAFGKLVKSAKKTIGLTGTLTNGSSTSVKELLWHMAPRELLKKGFDYQTGTIRWANNYGTVEKKNRIRYIDGRDSTSITERPGISPRLAVDFLLGCTAFLSMEELGLPMVEKKEIPLFINLDPEHQQAYEEFHQRLSELSSRGGKGAMIPATINYAGHPHNGARIVVTRRNREENREFVIEAPAISGLSASERKMVEVVEKELSENRGVAIFNNFTGEYETNQRVAQILRERGIEARIMQSSIAPEKRVEWLEKNSDAEVIISNISLIGEGLNLIPWPTLYFNQLSHSIDVVRQAAGRAHRAIIQKAECRNYYSVVNGTQQMRQFETICARRGHALLMEGKIDRSALAEYAQDAYSTLAANIADCLASNEAIAQMSNSWDELSKAELAGIEIVEENEYEDTLKRALVAMGNKTREMCGIISSEESGEIWVPANVSFDIIEKTVKRGRKILATEGQLALSF